MAIISGSVAPTEKSGESAAFSSRGDMTRTCDPLVPNQMRYQLRHTPMIPRRTSVVRWRSSGADRSPSARGNKDRVVWGNNKTFR